MHLGALSLERKKILAKLHNFKDFYLAGGTALALQIGHRVSIDFDLFSDKPIPKKLLPQAEKIFLPSKLKIIVNNSNELTIYLNETKITFLHYPYKPILKKIIFENLNFLSIKEIAATKAYTIGRRGSYKDYIDLYFALTEKYLNLENLIKIAEKKFKNDFNARLFLEQLIYYKDIKDTGIKFLDKEIAIDDLEKFFKNQISKIKIS